jgi:hypothetical protein
MFVSALEAYYKAATAMSCIFAIMSTHRTWMNVAVPGMFAKVISGY